MSAHYHEWSLNPTFTVILKKCIEAGVTPALYGDAGIGKSCTLEDLAKLLNTKCFTVACNQLAGREDVTQPRIVKITNSKGNDDFKSIFVVADAIKEAADYASANPRETPILFLDEYNRVPSDLTTGLMSLITTRKAGSVVFPPNLRIVIAGNSIGNVASDDDAVVTRLVNFYVKPDVTTFFNANYIKNNMNPSMKSFLMAHNDALLVREPSDDGDMDYGDEVSQAKQYTCPRTLEYLSRFLNTCTEQELDNWESQSLLLPLIEAFIGKTTTAEGIHKEILKDIANNQISSGAQVALVKPAIYDELKKMKKISDIEAKLASISLKEKASVLAYALFEKEDNTNLITAFGTDCLDWTDPSVTDVATTMFSVTKNGVNPDVQNFKYYLSRVSDKYLGVLFASVSGV